MAFFALSCGRDEDSNAPTEQLSTDIPAAYHGTWDIYEYDNGVTQGASTSPMAGFSVKFNSNNSLSVVTPNISYSATAVYKKNGTTDSFSAQNDAKVNLIINSSDRPAGGKIMTLTFSPLQPNNYNYTLSVKKQ